MKIKAFLFIVFVSLLGCGKSEYDQLVKEEMDKGIVHDSILLGLEFGQTKKEFFEQCWRMNKKGLISQGPKNQFVKYILPKKGGANLKSDVIMLFYGAFNDQNVMTGMDIQFYHDSWSLWNKDLQSDQLLLKIKDSLRAWYPGNDFINVRKDSLNIFVKVDGNRRITIRPIDNKQIVKAKIDDLRYVLNK